MTRGGPNGHDARADLVAVVGTGIAVPGASDTDELWKLVCGDQPVFAEPLDRYRLDFFFSADHAAPDRTYVRASGHLHDFRPHHRLAEEIATGAVAAADLSLVWLRHCLLQAGDTVTVRDTDRYAYYVGSSILAGQRTDEAALIDTVASYTAGHAHPADAARRVEAEGRLRTLLEGHYERGGRAPRDTMPVAVARAAAAGLLPGDCEFGIIDSACSSSLYAIDQGIGSLLVGDCDIAYCGGVSGLTPRFNVTFAKLRGLSQRGAVRALDQHADGTLFADGVGIVALKRLDRAVADGDQVLGVLLGHGGSSDGQGTAIYSPNPVGQRRCLDRAWRAAQVSADDIDWVVAHGTGTVVGDAVELRTLAAAVADGGVWCGSNKSLLGHSAWSSGVVSVIELLTALRQETIPAQRHFTALDAELAAETGDRIRVPITDVPWPGYGERPRIGGVSAFGFGGTNAHLVIADRTPTNRPVAAPRAADPVVLVAWTAHLPAELDPGVVVRGGAVPQPCTFGPSYPAPPFEDVRLPPPTVRATDPGQLMALRAAALFVAEHGELWAPMRATTGVIAAAVGPPPSALDHLVRCYADEIDSVLDDPDRTAFADSLATIRSTTPPTTKYTLPGILPNIIAARVTNRYDLGGTTMLVDTGGTSGLTAVHTAARYLSRGDLDMAVVVGVSATSRPEFARFIGVAQARIAEGAFLLALSRESVARAHGLSPLARLDTRWSRPAAGHTHGDHGTGATFLAADGILAVLRALHTDSAETEVVVGPAADEPGPAITLTRIADQFPPPPREGSR